MICVVCLGCSERRASSQGRFGDQAWGGARHPWNVLVGRMAPELLHWLQSEEAFVPQTSAFQALGLCFEGEGPGWRTEEGQKYVLSGWAGGRCSSRSMCGLLMRKPLPGRRLHAWFRAFRAVNQAGGTLLSAAVSPDTCLSMVVRCVRRCGLWALASSSGPGEFAWRDKSGIGRRGMCRGRVLGQLLSQGAIADMVHATKVEVRRWLRAFEEGLASFGADDDQGSTDNVTHFLETPIEDWFLTCGHFCVAKVRKPCGELWSESHHQDGGASVLHLGLTLWGRRDCVFEEVPGCRVVKWWGLRGLLGDPLS